MFIKIDVDYENLQFDANSRENLNRIKCKQLIFKRLILYIKEYINYETDF